MNVGRTWPEGSPRVLLTDCWLQNSGDAAIALAMDGIVRRAFPGAAVVHAAYGVEETAGRYPSLDVTDPLDALVGTRWQEPQDDEGARFVAEADVVISQGGGFLRAGYKPWARLDALRRVHALGPRTALLGQTLGVFDEAFARRDLRAVLTAASHVTVRDRFSLASAIELGCPADAVTLATDFALALAVDPTLLPAPGDRTQRPRPPADAVGVVLSDHAVPGEIPDRDTVPDLVLRAALDATDRDLVLWSSSQGIPGASDDDVVAQRTVARLPRSLRGRVHVVEGHLDAYDLLEWSVAFDSLVSMRFHPALLAAAAGIGSVLVMSDEKTSFFDGSAMSRRVVRTHDPADITAGVRAAVPAPARTTGAALLGPVLDRVAVVQDTLVAAVREAVPAD